MLKANIYKHKTHSHCLNPFVHFSYILQFSNLKEKKYVKVTMYSVLIMLTGFLNKITLAIKFSLTKQLFIQCIETITNYLQSIYHYGFHSHHILIIC